jgi:metal-dependent hydrolase (beta-lactamase superfamily II)
VAPGHSDRTAGRGDVAIYIPEAMTCAGSSPAIAEAPSVLADGVATTGLITYAQTGTVWLATPKADDQALAVNVAERGIVLITGCGHMGLQALLERAQNAFDAPVVGVVGGLHYGRADAAAVQAPIQLMQKLDPVIVALSPHDGGPAALDAFAQAFSAAYRPIRVGEVITVSQAAALKG